MRKISCIPIVSIFTLTTVSCHMAYRNFVHVTYPNCVIVCRYPFLLSFDITYSEFTEALPQPAQESHRRRHRRCLLLEASSQPAHEALPQPAQRASSQPERKLLEQMATQETYSPMATQSAHMKLTADICVSPDLPNTSLQHIHDSGLSDPLHHHEAGLVDPTLTYAADMLDESALH